MLTKLSMSEMHMIRGEQIGLADMLEDYEVGFYATQKKEELDAA